MLWNLGTTYEEANDVIKATELLRECLSIRENSLSSTHPGLISGMVHSIQHSIVLLTGGLLHCFSNLICQTLRG